MSAQVGPQIVVAVVPREIPCFAALTGTPVMSVAWAWSAYTEIMSVQREELLRLVEELAEDEVPIVLDDVRRHLRVVRGGSWPPEWFSSAQAKASDTAERSEDLLAEGFGRSA